MTQSQKIVSAMVARTSIIARKLADAAPKRPVKTGPRFVSVKLTCTHSMSSTHKYR